MDITGAIDYIHSINTFTPQGSLDDFVRLLNALGNPQENLRCVHVAGTNGKGSICAHLANALAGSGYKVGLYTSPYLVEFNERIAINGRPVSNDVLLSAFLKVKEVYEELKLTITQFAFITAMMFVIYSEHNVDMAVIEAGMGGINDPTVLCAPLVSVITSISLDHVRILGDTLVKIAENKAGIIKENTPVVLAPNTEEVVDVIKKRAQKQRSTCYYIDPSMIHNSKTTIEGGEFEFEGERYTIGLLGQHQLENAAVAIKTLKVLQQVLGVNLNIKEHISKTVWPGRLEILQRKPLVIIDGCHNPEGAKATASYIKNTFKGKNIILICGMAKDKAVEEIVQVLSQLDSTVIVTPLSTPRGCDTEFLANLFAQSNKQALIAQSAQHAIALAKDRAKENDLILACGSLYLVGEIKKIFKNNIG